MRVHTTSNVPSIMLAVCCLMLACAPDESVQMSGRRATATGDLVVGPFPEAEFGPNGVGAHDAFAHVSGGTRLPLGVITIADAREGVVLFYDQHGHRTATFQRSTAEAHRFRAMWIERCHGDSVFVWNPVERRVAVLTVAGTQAREYSVSANVADMACSPEGKVVVLEAPSRATRPSSTGASQRDSVALRVTSVGGNPTSFTVRVPFTQNRPLGFRTFVAIGGDRVYAGTGDSAFVNVYASNGALLGVLRVDSAPPRVPTARHYDEAISQIVADLLSDQDQAKARQYFEHVPPPKVLPAYSGLYLAPDETLWANLSALGDSATVLRAMSKEGRSLGDIRLPMDVRILDVGADYVLGAYRTRSGKEHVVLYRVGRRS